MWHWINKYSKIIVTFSFQVILHQLVETQEVSIKVYVLKYMYPNSTDKLSIISIVIVYNYYVLCYYITSWCYYSDSCCPDSAVISETIIFVIIVLSVIPIIVVEIHLYYWKFSW